MRELRGRGGLARSVHADDQKHLWFRRQRRNRHRSDRQNSPDFFARDFRDSAAVMVDTLRAFLERLDDPQCHRHAEIGPDERFLEFVPIDRLAGKFLNE